MGEDLVLGLFALLPCVFVGLLWAFARRIRRRKGRAGWAELALGNGLVLLLLLSLLVLGGEIYYRFIYNTTESMVYTKTSQHWLQRYWRENSDHIRDNIELANVIGAGKRRVTFLGDSFTAGHGVKDIEKRFVNRLRRAHPEWEVHSLAVPGFDTWEEQDILSVFMKSGYQIDQVVLVYCLNDVSDLLPGRAENLTRINAQVAGRGWLQRNSYFVDTVSHRLQARRDSFLKDYYGFVREGYRGPIWERQKQRLKELRDFVESHGGQLAVVTFPFLHALGPNYEYRFAHDELNGVWRELKVPHLDLLPVYENLAPKQVVVNRFDPHPNEYAHALAAEAIDKLLKEELKKPRQSLPAGKE